MNAGLNHYGNTLQSYGREIAGYAFWWVFYFMIIGTPIYYALGIPYEFDYHALIRNFNEMSLASGLFFGVIAFALSFHFDLWKWRKPLVWISAALMAIGTLMPLLPLLLGSETPQELSQIETMESLGGFVLGFGVSMLQISWGAWFFPRLSQDDVCLVTISSFVLSLPIAYLFMGSGIFGVVIALIAPFTSGALLLRSFTDIASDNTEVVVQKRSCGFFKNGVRRSPYIILMILTALYGLFFSVLRTIFLPQGSFSNADVLQFTLLVCFIVGIIVVLVFLNGTWGTSLASILIISAGFVAIGVFLLSMFGVGGQAMISAFMFGGIKYAEIATFIIAVTFCIGSLRSYSFQMLSLWRAVGCLGVLGGFVSSRIIVSQPLTSNMMLTLGLGILVILLVCSFVGVISFRNWQKKPAFSPRSANQPSDRQKSIETSKDEISNGKNAQVSSQNISINAHADEKEARMAELAQNAGLSQREEEVFSLLCNGRSVPFIADHLVIARSTAATHVKRIYRKLGVHTKQELFDLLDNLD